MTGNPDSYFSKTLAKGLRVLSLFDEANPVRTQTEIAKCLDANMTTTYRLVNTLVKLGYLEKHQKTKQIRLGLGSAGLAATLLGAYDGREAIKNLVNRFHEEFNVTVDVAVVVEEELRLVYRREAEDTLTYRLPSVNAGLHTTSLGKAYLAFLSEESLRGKLDVLPLDLKTSKSIASRKKLERELAITRKRGYALSDEEYLEGLITIGAPLLEKESGEAVGSVSIDFTTLHHSLESITRQYAADLIELSKKLSEAIAFKD